MITGHERQEATGGAWQLWLPWYCFFALYAPCEIGFTAWISPYATIFGLAVDCEEVSNDRSPPSSCRAASWLVLVLVLVLVCLT